MGGFSIVLQFSKPKVSVATGIDYTFSWLEVISISKISIIFICAILLSLLFDCLVNHDVCIIKIVFYNSAVLTESLY